MTNEINNRYIEAKQNRERTISHFKLAICMMNCYPILLIFFLPIVVLTVLIWGKIDFLISILDIPKMLLPVYNVMIKSLCILIPFIFLFGIIEAIGSLSARKDEATIQMAFEKNELRNGSPILVYKRKDKMRKVIIREWYSPIPLKTWIEHQDRIEHQMREHLVKQLDYDSKTNDNRIIVYSSKGIKPREDTPPVYDMELERDLEKY